MKKTIFTLLALCSVAPCAELPEVDIYMIRKMEIHEPTAGFPEVIVEIRNPTEKTFYVSGPEIERPVYHTEVLRAGRWLRVPRFVCGTGMSEYPLKPGTKMLVTMIDLPYEESKFRFRFFFWREPKRDETVVAVCTRAIDKKELGDLTGTIGELESDEKLEKTFELDRKDSEDSVAPDAEVDSCTEKANKAE